MKVTDEMVALAKESLEDIGFVISHAEMRAALDAALSVAPLSGDYLRGLERDADRYRWLRSRDVDTIDAGGVFIGKTPDNVVLSFEDADAAIDAGKVTQAGINRIG